MRKKKCWFTTGKFMSISMWKQVKRLKIHVDEIKNSISDIADTMATTTFQCHSVLTLLTTLQHELFHHMHSDHEKIETVPLLCGPAE